METICHSCGYKWNYTGNKNNASCPNCQTKTPIGKDKTKPKSNIERIKKLEEATSKLQKENAIIKNRLEKIEEHLNSFPCPKCGDRQTGYPSKCKDCETDYTWKISRKKILNKLLPPDKNANNEPHIWKEEQP